MALPVYEALKARYPGCVLGVLTNYPELFEENPFVDVVNPEEFNPDRYIFLRDDVRTVPRIAHYATLASVQTPDVPSRLYYEDWSTPLWDDVEGDGPLIAIAPEATWPTKRWPGERWRSVADALRDDGYRVIEVGAGHAAVTGAHSLVDKTSVGDAARVLHQSDLLVCSDSGLMHLALAAGIPVLALFGPTVPQMLVPNNANLNVITNARDCQGCWNELRMNEPGVCPLKIDECLGTIAVDAVVDRVRELAPVTRTV